MRKDHVLAQMPGLPIDYVLHGDKIFLYMIDGPRSKPAHAFTDETESELVNKKSPSRLVPVVGSEYPERSSLAGLIFHCARCGSTLLSNMLDTLSDCYVVRESAVLNKLLNDSGLLEGQRAVLLKTVVMYYCLYARALGARCVVKFSSHCVDHQTFILQHLLDTPWVYLYREPTSVIASLIKKRPSWASRVSAEFSPPQLCLRLKQGFALVAESYGKYPKISLLLHYQQLHGACANGAQIVADHFGFQVSPDGAARMTMCLQYESKTGLRVGVVAMEPCLFKLEAEKTCQEFCWEEYEYLCDNT